ncbi:methionine aminopeptidase [Leucobacter chromiireducens]|uniref:methionine aminopeptidase n=1 Tax=Leucobacter chromiireducens TaxID=283877 RepID=UPI000F644286|nr:methionine aminopeptidase [Leucobacter chromiireducens]
MSKRDWGIEDPEETYWFNTRTGEVEEGPQSLSVDRVGPFATREEAAHANQILERRARAWREEDEANEEL